MKKSSERVRLNISDTFSRLIMTTEREYQERKKKRQRSSYKSRQSNPVFLWLLGLLAVSALLTVKSYQPTYNLPTSSPESNSIEGQQI